MTASRAVFGGITDGWHWLNLARTRGVEVIGTDTEYSFDTSFNMGGGDGVRAGWKEAVALKRGRGSGAVGLARPRA